MQGKIQGKVPTLHKATTFIAKNHGIVAIEDLKVCNMTKKKSLRKRGLNRSILDASFGEFRRLLEYKGRLYGCKVIAVPPAYTSQRCSVCGHTERANRKSQSIFCCVNCGFQLNADWNAALNILVAASLTETKNACGEDVRPIQSRLIRQPSVKQESQCLS